MENVNIENDFGRHDGAILLTRDSTVEARESPARQAKVYNLANLLFMQVKFRQKQGSFSSTYLCAAFTPIAPQRVRTQSSCQCLFTLL
jgi:hypothetical protein